MDRSLGFGSIIYDLVALFRLDFSSAPLLTYNLTLPYTITRWTVLQKVRYRTCIVLYLLVNIGFQVLFHSPPGVLFTFPSRYLSLSVTKQYLALRDGPRSFIRDFSCLALLWILLVSAHFSYTGLSPSMVCFPKTFLLNLQMTYCSPNPKSITTSGLGSSYFARHYSRNRVFFLFLWVLRCFSSPRYLLIHYFTHVQVIRLLPLIEFPHSDIYGLMDICSSPQLFAACHVLLRLLVPRHSPYALCSLTYFLGFSLLNKHFNFNIVLSCFLVQLLFQSYLF